MAEVFLKQKGGDKFQVESAGFEPGKLNPIVVEAMSEIGIDISKNQTKSVFDLYKQGRLYDYVISVCDEASAERCPIFPGKAQRIHMGFKDPSSFQGTKEEKLNGTRTVRDEIRLKIEEWITKIKS